MGPTLTLPAKTQMLALSEFAQCASPLAALNAALLNYDENPDYRALILHIDAELPPEPLARSLGSAQIGSLRTAPSAILRPEKTVVGINSTDCINETLILFAQVTDIRIGVHGTRYGFPALSERPLAAGVRSRIFRQVAHSASAELLFVPDTITAEEALRTGLVSTLAKADEALAVAFRYAADIASLSPFAARGEKETLLRGELLTFEAAGHYAVTVDMISHISPDGLEGIASFVEKRPPSFWDFTKD